MWQFFGLERVQQSSVRRGANYDTARQRWANRDSSIDNLIHIGRIILSLRILGLPGEAFYFYWVLSKITKLKSKELWQRAMNSPLYFSLGTTFNLRPIFPWLEPGYLSRPSVLANSTTAGLTNTIPAQATRPTGQQTTTHTADGQAGVAPPSQNTLPRRQQTTSSTTTRQPNVTTAAGQTSSFTIAVLDRTAETRHIKTEDAGLNLPAVEAAGARTTSSESQARLPKISEYKYNMCYNFRQ